MISHGGLIPRKQASHHVVRMNIQEKGALDYWVLLIASQPPEGTGPLLNLPHAKTLNGKFKAVQPEPPGLNQQARAAEPQIHRG